MSLHFPRLRRHTQPMTEGSILRHLLAYAIPAILGDLFQVTYNTVDSIIVGKYAGADALAAVGVASPLMSIAMFFIIGMGIGASVLMSEFYGAQDARSLRREFSTTLIISLALSAAIGAGLFLLAGPLLRLVNTPPEILSETTRYLRIVALGMVVTGLYNILAAASRSVGDTRTPLACLVAGSLINVALDLLFVAGLHWGVAGAAGATVISQACAAVLCGWLLYRNEPVFFSETSGDGKPGFRRDFGVDRALLGRTLRFSYASALQQAGIYVGKLLVQSMVNPLGVHAAAAFTAVNRIDDYALIPERDIGNGETVLVAQNHGAKKPERMQRGLWTAMAIEAIYGAIISVCVFALAEPLMRLFVNASETEVIRLGTRYLRLMGFFYFMPGLTNGLQGYMRAIGKMKLTMYVTYSQMFTRAFFTWLLIGRMHLDAVPLACVAGWILMMVWELGLILYWKRKETLYQL
ncbi:MAG: MATE family efflux transporter [Clostridia bacterium]|nr:MATE family efflux transporter [Clostridia bacterium]